MKVKKNEERTKDFWVSMTLGFAFAISGISAIFFNEAVGLAFVFGVLFIISIILVVTKQNVPFVKKIGKALQNPVITIKKKFKERSDAWHWSNAITVLGFFLLLAVLVLVILWPARTAGSVGCDITGIKWVMMEEGEECWLYDANEVETTWKTPPLSQGDTIWELKWDKSKHCPLPTNIKCKGDFDALVPITALFELIR